MAGIVLHRRTLGRPAGRAARFRFGTTDFVAPNGNVWTKRALGNMYSLSNAIAGTTMPGLYQQGAFTATGDVLFTGIENGRYQTIVHIMEPYDNHLMGLSTTVGGLSEVPAFDPGPAYGTFTAIRIVLPNYQLITNNTALLRIIAYTGNGAVVSAVEFLPV